MTTHCSDEQIGVLIHAYELDALSDEDRERFEIHLIGCDHCFREVTEFTEASLELRRGERVKAIIRESFRESIIHSISSLDVAPVLRQRVGRWMKNLSGRTGAILDIAVDSSKKKARILQEGFESIIPAAGRHAFSPVPQPVRTLGAPEEGTIAVESTLPSWLKVTVDPAARRIVVQGERREEPLPLIILVLRDEQRAFIEEFRRPEDTDFILAEFENLPDGEYVMLLESVD